MVFVGKTNDSTLTNMFSFFLNEKEVEEDFVCLAFYILTKSKVISGRVLTCDSATL